MNIAKPVNEIKKNIFNSYKNCFKKYFNFSDRSSRYDYWSFMILHSIIVFILGLFSKFSLVIAIIYLAYAIVLLIPSIALTIRRLHDLNKSGWFLLVSFVPIVNIYFLYIMTQKGDLENNRFGDVVEESIEYDITGRDMAIGYYSFFLMFIFIIIMFVVSFAAKMAGYQ